MDISHINALIDLMEERSLASLEVQDGDNKVSLQRHLPQSVASPQLAVANPSPQPTTPSTPRGAVETSPMVGVFYAAPTPSDPPFVKVGQHVEAGDSLGIIEAMKIMNPLEATQSGIIAEILVQNGDVVQFGQPVIRYQA